MMIVSDLINRGEAAIDHMVAERQEENLHLEFKTLSNDAALTRDDRKMIARAVCGLANAEGGAVVVGVETKRIDGVDVASGKRPIRNFDRYQRLLTGAMPELLSPQLPGITIQPITSDDGQGYLVIDVPRSDDRPHMSVN